jgi:long-chain fatty acid transport protein
MIRAQSVGAAALLATMLATGSALASPLFELSGGTSSGGGLNPRATGAGAPSTYFNPALLPEAAQGFELGVLVLSDRIGISVDGRDRGDVPDIVGDRELVDSSGAPISNVTAPTRWLQRGCDPTECRGGGFLARPRQSAGSSGNTRAYQIIGLVNRIAGQRLVIGLYSLVPIGPFTTANSFYNDEREQFFTNSLHPELYSDRLTATSVAFGAGSKVTDWLSLGLSFTLNLRNGANAGTYVRDANDYNQLLLTTNVDVHASVAPHFGVVIKPVDWLNLTGTVHSEQKFVIDTTFSALLPSGLQSSTTRTAVHDFVPWTFSGGLEAELAKGSDYRISAVATGSYGLWSYYLDRHGESPASYGNYLAWSNTFSGAVGARVQSGAARAMLDVSYVPTPVPPQTGRSNYVDNDRGGLSAGGDYGFELMGLKFRAGLMGQVQVLLERRQEKLDRLVQDELPDDSHLRTGGVVPGRAGLQTNNPGWPGFSSKGTIFGGSATLALLY